MKSVQKKEEECRERRRPRRPAGNRNCMNSKKSPLGAWSETNPGAWHFPSRAVLRAACLPALRLLCLNRNHVCLDGTQGNCPPSCCLWLAVQTIVWVGFEIRQSLTLTFCPRVPDRVRALSVSVCPFCPRQCEFCHEVPVEADTLSCFHVVCHKHVVNAPGDAYVCPVPSCKAMVDKSKISTSAIAASFNEQQKASQKTLCGAYFYFDC